MTTNRINTILVLLLLVAGYLLMSREPPTVKIVESTVIRDTTIIDTTIINISYPIFNKIVRIDTIEISDTLKVYIPISKQTFKGKGYEITTEGYKTKLLKVVLSSETRYIDKLVNTEITLPPRRISHGLNFGIGLMYGSKGLDFGAYVGYGITIRL